MRSTSERYRGCPNSNTGVTHLDPVQDAGVEDVDTGVDPVSDKLDRLFDESVDHRRAGLGDDDTVRRGLGDLGDHDRTFAAVASVEVSEGLEGVGAGDVRVEDEEGRVVLAQDFTGEGERTGRTERLGLDGEGDGDTVLFLGLFEHGDHDFGSVVDSEDNVLDTGLDEGLNIRMGVSACVSHISIEIDRQLTSIWCKLIRH